MSNINSNTAVAGIVGLSLVAIVLSVKYKLPKKISKDIELTDYYKNTANIGGKRKTRRK